VIRDLVCVCGGRSAASCGRLARDQTLARLLLAASQVHRCDFFNFLHFYAIRFNLFR
jgi:hypothetical protein